MFLKTWTGGLILTGSVTKLMNFHSCSRGLVTDDIC